MSRKEKPVLIIPNDVADSINRVFGKRHHLLPQACRIVEEQQTTWDAIRCAVDNLENGTLHTVHIRPRQVNRNFESSVSSKGGCTVVFMMPAYRGNMVTVSVSWCNENETFNPKQGRLFAANNYVHQRSIQIRLPQKGRYSSQIKELFSNMISNTTFLE